MVVRRQVDEKASTEKPCRDSYRLRDWVHRWNKPERFPEMADALAGKHLPSREMTRLTLLIAMQPRSTSSRRFGHRCTHFLAFM